MARTDGNRHGLGAAALLIGMAFALWGMLGSAPLEICRAAEGSLSLISARDDCCPLRPAAANAPLSLAATEGGCHGCTDLPIPRHWLGVGRTTLDGPDETPAVPAVWIPTETACADPVSLSSVESRERGPTLDPGVARSMPLLC